MSEQRKLKKMKLKSISSLTSPRVSWESRWELLTLRADGGWLHGHSSPPTWEYQLIKHKKGLTLSIKAITKSISDLVTKSFQSEKVTWDCQDLYTNVKIHQKHWAFIKEELRVMERRDQSGSRSSLQQLIHRPIQSNFYPDGSYLASANNVLKASLHSNCHPSSTTAYQPVQTPKVLMHFHSK